jgi:hypothetical protein
MGSGSHNAKSPKRSSKNARTTIEQLRIYGFPDAHT